MLDVSPAADDGSHPNRRGALMGMTKPFWSKVQELQSSIRGVAMLSAIPAVSVNQGARELAETLADSLVQIGELEFAYISFREHAESDAIEIVRAAGGSTPERTAALHRSLTELLRAHHPPTQIDNPLSGTYSRIAIARLGPGRDQAIVIGSRDPYFPTDGVRLLLNIAANQMTVAVQRLRVARQAREIETAKRVIESTRQLTMISERLSTEKLERKRAEEALRTAQLELARVLRVTTVGQLAATIAHEINQPLAAALTNAGACLRWLANDTPDLDEVRASLQRIVRDIQRIDDVTGTIRTLARKGSVAHAPLDINAAIQEVLTLTHGELERHDISLRADLAAGLPKVLGDRVQLQQVILNLVVNAIESMITVKDRQRHLCVISKMEDCGMVSVEVRDSGPGLDSKTMSRIFEAFFTTKVEGMGLGLSICRSIMDSHGGLLWTSPASPDGASFFIAVPQDAASG